MTPALTTVHIHTQIMAFSALQLLLDFFFFAAGILRQDMRVFWICGAFIGSIILVACPHQHGGRCPNPPEGAFSQQLPENAVTEPAEGIPGQAGC